MSYQLARQRPPLTFSLFPLAFILFQLNYLNQPHQSNQTQSSQSTQSTKQISKALFRNADNLNQDQAYRSIELQVLITKIADSYNPAYGHREKKSSGAKSAPTFKGLKWFFTPVMSPLLQNRWVVLIFAGIGVIQLALTTAALPGWQCPVRAAFGVTCPGCGLTTAIALLLKGDWQSAVQTHAFAPLILGILIFMLAAVILPAAYLNKISERAARLERKTGITAIILLGMIIYWLLRVFEFI